MAEKVFNFFDNFKDYATKQKTSLDESVENVNSKLPLQLSVNSNSTNKIYYKTDHPNIGIALIFNHYEFLNSPASKRIGTKTDTESITTALELFGFDVRLYEELKAKEIEAIIKEASQENHSDSDCLVVVVMTHGKNGELKAYDEYYPIENLWTPFFGDNCKSLINKPKLFFIQACRGLGLEDTVEFKDSTTTSQSVIEIDENFKKTYTIPSSADLLIMYSCYEGKSSVRHPIIGSWFIQSLSQLLHKYSKMSSEFDLYHLLTAVIQNVAYEYQVYAAKNKDLIGKKQMPNFTSTLTKLLLLKPKLK